MTDLLDRQLTAYGKNPAAAKELLAIGRSPLTPDLDDIELAAWTNVSRVVLNLHDSVTRK